MLIFIFLGTGKHREKSDLAFGLDSRKVVETLLNLYFNLVDFLLQILKDGLSALHVPYAYGFAIILLTVLVKAATFPLTKKQVLLPNQYCEV